jgi:hypothetical protein
MRVVASAHAHTHIHMHAQVLMDTQFENDKYGGRISRPVVIPRHSNQGIVTSNFKLVCEGKVCVCVFQMLSLLLRVTLPRSCHVRP